MRGPKLCQDKTAGGPLRDLIFGLLGLVLLNCLFTYQNLYPTPWVRLAPLIGVELFALLALLAGAHAIGLRRTGPLRAGLVPLLFAAFWLRYVDVTAPALFGRDVNLYWDMQHLPNLLRMFWRAAGPLQAMVTMVGLLAGLSLLLFLIWMSLTWIDRALEQPRPRAAALALAAVVCATYLWSLTEEVRSVRHAFAAPVVEVADKHLQFISRAYDIERAGPRLLEELADRPQAVASDLLRLEGAPVIVIFIESYGASLLDNPDYAAAIAPSYQALGQRLNAAGWHSASRRLVSPTFGGGSWRAHATLLSGIPMTSQELYNLFVSASLPGMTSAFKAAGYRTLAVMPGTQRYWPEGAAYGFDAIYDAAALDYRGPDFGFWRIPDQFTLQRLYDLEAAEAGRPLFAMAVLIMSHMPFQPVPPYLADWSGVADGRGYDPDEAARLVGMERDWSQLGAHYVAALRYELEIVGDYVAELASPDALVVVLGDHQPPAIVAGQEQPWEVPIHLLSRDPQRLVPFLAAGYGPGLIPERGAPRGLESVFGDLLGAYDSKALLQAGHQPEAAVR